MENGLFSRIQHSPYIQGDSENPLQNDNWLQNQAYSKDKISDKNIGSHTPLKAWK